MSLDSQPVQARMLADIDAPDRVLYGLTAHQVALLAATGTVLWLAYQAVTPTVPATGFAVAALPVGAIATAIALGRRDGISMDRWIAAAVRAWRSPHRLVAAPEEIPAAPPWAPPARHVGVPVLPLRLPACAIGDTGVIDLDGGRVALTAATTVNFDLRATGEQHALVDAMGRWLNSLSQPVQIVISTRRADLGIHADRIDNRLDQLPHPALADAAAGYAQFLRDLAVERDPLDRHLLIAHQVGAPTDPSAARRAAEHTARALTGLGASTRVLDGGEVTDALVGACDPWRNVGTGRTIPHAVITSDTGGDR
ncbi:MAG: PrgI family protein [Micromonosporaceae bacterium]|nr:PrgI family protein [Micromonosporaceae bacterium]